MDDFKTKEESEEPKDFQAKIGTKAEAEWTTMLKIQEKNILVGQVNIDIAKEVLKLCEKKIKEETEKH